MEAQQADWTLSRADNQFLQEQLDARNKLIDELSEGLKNIEEHQVQLEQENDELEEEVRSLKATLEAVETANLDLEKQVEHLAKVKGVVCWRDNPSLSEPLTAFCLFGCLTGSQIPRAGDR